MRRRIWRAVVEVGFIVFLFYANLLMGEYSHSGLGRVRGLVWAVADIWSGFNFAIAMVAAVLGYFVLSYLRKRL